MQGQDDMAALALMQGGAAAGGPVSQLAAAVAGTGEPKGALNHFCQRYCKRPVTKDDIVYTSAKYGKVFQVTVTLNCMEGQAFVGETASTLKEAEKNAAYQALVHFEPLNDSLPAASSKNKKRKTPATTTSAAALTLGGVRSEEPALKAMKTADGGAAALASASNPALTCKVVLNTVCMKLLHRPMQKGEVVYETHQTPIGFQSTVRLPCLPGEWGELAWAGEVASQQKQAEQNAAKEALEAVNQSADQIKSLLPQQPVRSTGGKGAGGGGGWCDGGKGWGGKCKGGKGKWDYWGKGMMGWCDGGKGWGGMGMGGMGIRPGPGMGMGTDMGMGGWGGGKGCCKGGGGDEAAAAGGGEFEGPEHRMPKEPMPKTRVSEVAITGEIIEWKGKYGWLRPHAEIQHPMAKKRGGRVFMSSKDVAGSLDLAVGSVVQFHVYEDPTGLGAEEVTAF